jgi:hypothetical protein
MEWNDQTVALAIAVATMLGNGIGWAVKAWWDKHKYNSIIQKALKILLRRELSIQHNIYMNKGRISRIGLQEFESTLETYEALTGSNGYVQDLAEDIRNLDIEVDKHHG